MLPDVPMRTSSLRGLGAWANVFAIESFIDELAEIAGEDPVTYRLSLLSDPRARRVVETAARDERLVRAAALPEGRARGFGFARYKNIASFAAVVVEVEVEEEMRLKRVWCAADAGLVITPDGAKNQIEGGIIMGASFVMREQVRSRTARSRPGTWEDYPILRFSEVPEIEIEVIDKPNEPTLGLGEASVGPTGRGDRQCAGPRARQAGPRFAADAGADHGYSAGRIDNNRKLVEGGCNDGSSGRAFAGLVVAGALALAGPATAQELQSGKPIRIIVGLSAGGGTDVTARLIAQQMTANTGMTVLVENRAGGNFIPALRTWHAPLRTVTRSFSLDQFADHPAAAPRLSVRSHKFMAVTEVATGPLILVVRNDLGVKS